MFQQLPVLWSNVYCPFDHPYISVSTRMTNDLRDIHMSKEASQLLACRLNNNNSLEQGTKITFYHTREKNLRLFSPENNLLFCYNRGILGKIKVRLFNGPQIRQLLKD